MLSNRQKNIVSILEQEQDWIKGATLSAKINVTPRTLRNDINSINYQYNNLIESSGMGYRFRPEMTLPPSFYASNKFAGKEERISYVTSRLLISEHPLDLYDLSEELFVSLQTLEKDMRLIEVSLQEQGLKLEKKASEVSVSGSEQNRRKTLCGLVYHELNEKFHDLATYREYFEDIELYSIKTMLYQIMEAHKINANEYSINAIVLHIGISISRVKNNKIIDKSYSAQTNLKDHTDFALAEEIAGRIQKEFHVDLPAEEVYYLAFILIGKMKPDYSHVNRDNIEMVAEREYIMMVQEILDEINDTYGLCLYGNEVFVRFVIHVKDLLIRVKNNFHTKNPLNESMKLTYPLIYDLAVFIAEKLHKKTGYGISEDEIGYLAIHVGACLESNNRSDKIKTLLLCPQYYNIHNSIAAGIMKKSGDVIQIIGVESRLKEEDITEEVKLIISTSPIHIEKDMFSGEFITIHPFLRDTDFKKIDEAVKRIKQSELKKNYLYIARNSFQKELFFLVDRCENEWAAIEFLSKQMQEKGYVTENFFSDVKKREELSSTTYGGNFSIPHSTEMNAQRTGIGVMISANPIPWGEFKVSLVLLIGVNQKDAKYFADFYEELIGILLKEENIQNIVKSSSYETFIDRISTDKS